MAVLAIVMAVAVPQLKGFSAGRKYDAEWNRFMTALRYARNEAISRSVPVEIRFDTERNVYSLAGGYGFDHLPDGTTEHALPEELEFEITQETKTETGPASTTNLPATTPASAISVAPETEAASAAESVDDTQSVLFWPDGTVDDASPAEIRITERNGVFSKAVQKNAVLGYSVPAEGFDELLQPE